MHAHMRYPKEHYCCFSRMGRCDEGDAALKQKCELNGLSSDASLM